MSHTYIKFKKPSSQSHKKDGTVKTSIKKAIISIASIVIPKANPDFDKLIDEVEEWLVEYDNEGDFVNREIGLDGTGKVIIIMPWKQNYGYWIDNNLNLSDFSSHFSTTILDKEVFEHHWNDFEDRHY